MRRLSHRVSGAHAVRPALQAWRLYAARRGLESCRRSRRWFSPLSPTMRASLTLRPELTRRLRRMAGSRITTTSISPSRRACSTLAQSTAIFGAFIQATYATDYSRVFGLDNTDIRYASTGTIGNLDFIYGVTVNNNPTVQDVWNTVPAGASLTLRRISRSRRSPARCWKPSVLARRPAPALTFSLTTSFTPSSAAMVR